MDSIAEGPASACKRLPRQRPVRSDAGRGDRLPPHSPEAEEGVLGCILLSPRDCISECIEKFNGAEDVFYDLRHQTLYRAMVEMYAANEAIDIITLQQRLKDKQLLEEVGGIGYIADLPDRVPSAANISYYLAIVFEKAVFRRLIHTWTEIVGATY